MVMSLYTGSFIGLSQPICPERNAEGIVNVNRIGTGNAISCCEITVSALHDDARIGIDALVPNLLTKRRGVDIGVFAHTHIHIIPLGSCVRGVTTTTT